jgi:hypothetical protein
LYATHDAPMPAMQPAVELSVDAVLTVLPTLSAYLAGVWFHAGDAGAAVRDMMGVPAAFPHAALAQDGVRPGNVDRPFRTGGRKQEKARAADWRHCRAGASSPGCNQIASGLI